MGKRSLKSHKGKGEEMPPTHKGDSKKTWQVLTLILLIAGIALLLVSSALPWGTLKVEKHISGLASADANLEGEISLYGYSYHLETEGSTFGGQSRDVERMFIEGVNRDMLQSIGLLFDSTLNISYKIDARTWNPAIEDFETMTAKVETDVDLIPWWIDGIEQECTIRVEADGPPEFQVTIKRIYIELLLDYYEDKLAYNDSKVIWEKSIDEPLGTFPSEWSHTTSLSIGLDEVDGRFGLVGLADLEVTYHPTGGNASQEVTPSPGFSDNPNPINLNLATKAQGIKIVMAVLSFPLILISAAFTGIGMTLMHLTKRKRMGFILITLAMILTIIALVSIHLGITTLLDITKFHSFFSWTGARIIGWSGGMLLIGAFVMILIFRPYDISKKKKGDEDGQGKMKVKFKASKSLDSEGSGSEEGSKKIKFKASEPKEP